MNFFELPLGTNRLILQLLLQHKVQDKQYQLLEQEDQKRLNSEISVDKNLIFPVIFVGQLS